MQRRSTITFLVVISLFGATFGIYEILIPFYLQSRGITFSRMGDIFAVSFLFAFLMRQYAGYLSDLFGRKPFFSAALFLCGLSNFCTPLFKTASAQTFLKSLREGAFGIKETMQSVILYEGSEKDFLNIYGKNRGTEWIFQALGILLAGMIATRFSFAAAFFVSGAILFLATIIFVTLFPAGARNEQKQRLSIQGIFSFDLTGRLRSLTFIWFVINISSGAGHGPTLPLFFQHRFGMSLAAITVVMFIHRLALGMPMFLAGRVKGSHLKSFYILFLTIGGLSLIATPFIPKASWAIPVWLAHDLVGAGVWVPIHNYLTQKFAGEDIRGLSVAKSLAYGSLGTVIGFFLSGYLYAWDIGMPFIFSGVIALIAGILLVRF